MGSPGATRNRARFPRPKTELVFAYRWRGICARDNREFEAWQLRIWSWARSMLRMPGAGFASAAIENSGRGRRRMRVDATSILRLADAGLLALQSGRQGVADTESSHAIRRSTRSGLPSRRVPPLLAHSLSPSKTFPHTHHAPLSVEFPGGTIVTQQDLLNSA